MKAELIGKPTHIQVYETKDYDKFEFVIGNRALSQIHVRQLIASIKKRDFLPQTPIIVNREGGIIDGQHRLLAAKSLEKPIYYIIRENATLDDAIMLNTSLKNWGGHDYFQSWLAMNKPEYLKLKQFMEKYQFSLYFCITLLTQNYTRPEGKEVPNFAAFKNGEFEVYDLKEAEEMADFLKEFRLVCQGGVWMKVKFLRAVHELKQTTDPRKLTRQLEKYRLLFTKRETTKEYLEQMHEILAINSQLDMTRLV